MAADDWLWDVEAIDATTAWTVGSGGLIGKTEDGTSWGFFDTPYPDLYGVAFVDELHGWAVGGGGTILATSDGGLSWEEQDSGTTDKLRDVAFANATNGWAVGDAGTVLTTADGGENWTLQFTAAKGLRGVTFTSATNGWIVGLESTILATTDGGANWELQGVGVDPDAYNLFGVAFASPTNGWAVGDHGTILATTNGGASWELQGVGTTAKLLRGVATTDVDHVWAVGYEGRIILTTDGGANWSRQPSGTENHLLAASFADNSRGWAVGENVERLYTTTGDWPDIYAPTTTASGVNPAAWYRTAQTVTFAATDVPYFGGSGVDYTEHSRDGGANWTPGTSVDVDGPNGRNAVLYRSVDNAGNVEAEQSVNVNIDTVGPTNYGKKRYGYRYRSIPLYYKVADKYSPKAYNVKIYVKNSSGKVVKRLYLGDRKKSTWYRAWWKTSRRGTYRYYVYAKDAAGNKQRIVGFARVYVR